jgi:general L-amino acid transport system substrate-binding protein
MSLDRVSAICLATLLVLTGCVTPGDEPVDEGGLLVEIKGCTYDYAPNFNPNATVDDGSCSIDDVLTAEYNEGYGVGYNSGMNDGYDEGYLNGTEDGYNDGYNDGYDVGYNDGFDEGSPEKDYYWQCFLSGVSANALDDFSEESFEAAWSEQPGNPDWCDSEFSYNSLELGESVMSAPEDEIPEYFDWDGSAVARSDHYYWYNGITEAECEDIGDIWKSVHGGFCGMYVYSDAVEVDKGANLIYECDTHSGFVWWGKYEIVGDYMYIGAATPLSSGGDVATTCDAGYYEGYGEGYDDGYDEGYDDASFTSTLDTIIERGYLKCGVKDTQYGMGYWDEDSETYTGLDIDYCKAIAAAIGLNPDTDIEYIPTSGANRWDYLASGIVDVLIRTSTWTASRDADLDADFAAINFYDGQGILVNKDAFPNATSALHLDGAKICVAAGSTSAGNIADYFAANNMQYDEFESDYEDDDFKNEECDAITGDMSALVASKWTLTQDDEVEFEMAIMPELLSKEPLASVTRDYDSEWNEVVSWVWYGMLTAEELGVNSTNYEELAENSCDGEDYDAAICRLLTQNLGLGTDANPLSETWMQDVLAAVGNYEEAYTEAFCTYDETGDCLIDRAGTLNAPWWEGGLQYAPPMR